MIEAIIRAAILLLEVFFRLQAEKEKLDPVKEGLKNEDPTAIAIGLRARLTRVRDVLQYYPERLRSNLQTQLEKRAVSDRASERSE